MEMTIMQIIMSVLLIIDIVLTIYAQLKGLTVQDEYFIFQQSFNIYYTSIVKIVVGSFLVYYLNTPTLLYGPVVAVPAYGFFVILMSYHIFQAMKKNT